MVGFSEASQLTANQVVSIINLSHGNETLEAIQILAFSCKGETHLIQLTTKTNILKYGEW